jgi:hypothetical protein
MFLRSVSEAFSWSTLASRSADNSSRHQICNEYSVVTTDGIPLFFWRRVLFFLINSSLFA